MAEKAATACGTAGHSRRCAGPCGCAAPPSLCSSAAASSVPLLLAGRCPTLQLHVQPLLPRRFLSRYSCEPAAAILRLLSALTDRLPSALRVRWLSSPSSPLPSAPDLPTTQRPTKKRRTKSHTTHVGDDEQPQARRSTPTTHTHSTPPHHRRASQTVSAGQWPCWSAVCGVLTLCC